MTANTKAKKSRPKTGERRAHRLPLSIDLLPMDVLETIKQLRARYGLGWTEIERLSSLPYKEDWAKQLGKSGFIDWDAMPAAVRRRFPDYRLPHTNLHRWYDLRVSQAAEEALARSTQAREIARAFAAANIKGADEAVINAARDVIFEMLQAQDDRTRVKASAGLIALAEVMNGAKANAIKERKVAVDERKIVQLEKDAELKRKRMEQETESVAKKLNKGELGIDDINRLRERTFGLPPIAAKSR